MLDPALGRFDHVVAMDSLIHYRAADIVRALAALAPRTAGSLLVTVAPRTALLTLMHAAGKLFPKGDRAPAIVPSPSGAAAAHRGASQRWRTSRWRARAGSTAASTSPTRSP